MANTLTENTKTLQKKLSLNQHTRPLVHIRTADISRDVRNGFFKFGFGSVLKKTVGSVRF